MFSATHTLERTGIAPLLYTSWILPVGLLRGPTVSTCFSWKIFTSLMCAWHTLSDWIALLFFSSFPCYFLVMTTGLWGSYYLFSSLHLPFVQLCRPHCFNFMQEVVLLFWLNQKCIQKWKAFRFSGLEVTAVFMLSKHFYQSNIDFTFPVFLLSHVNTQMRIGCRAEMNQTFWCSAMFHSWTGDKIHICMRLKVPTLCIKPLHDQTLS